ncbi:MAG: pca operon transcription factor PcaQ [Confluentimicrobium sp.]|mgnify:CR=1 FL=1|jgi:LysR family transcriptional regulator, pca operon transcriptional activator|uniref:pca operon transcription factor PcaQ n=1 Tax=Actibacterium sp. TaxID=1872125 RepID=UPI000C58750D|nr:pca operon transcription factor PcaQ [Actibacterium sp.]MBC55760.1 pca operon transcription factor PcaQ [Actibacterium sp.]|tara:strand:+ start:512 stop:1420 length:909 start_codon:yes stop_codon:yes gene_type:complete
MDPRIRLRHIRCFLETARLNSVSAAAESLHISQPAASKTLRELEEALGTSLFDRTGRRMVTNRAGKLFQQHAGAAMLALSRAESSVRKGAQESTQLAVGVLPSVASEVFPLAAMKFRAQNPHCILRVMTGPNWLLLTQLREGALDMVVGRMAPTEDMAGLSFRHLYSDRVVLAVRPGHPLIGQPITPETLANHPLMLPPKGALIGPVVRDFLLSIGAQGLTAAYQNVSLAFGRRILQMSDCVWFISRGVVIHEISTGQLAEIPLPTEILAGPVGLSLRDNTVMSDTHHGMANALREVAESAR